MQIPGLDLLNSDPEAVIHGAWLTAAMPSSAARLTGRRRVMTEVSDFSQKMSGSGPVDLAKMQAAAAWQAAWDVTDFTLYYGVADRSPDDYRAYCDFVGRLNAVLYSATPTPDVLLYYPILDLWSEYIPVADVLQVSNQSSRARQIVASFQQLGQALQRNQIPFTLIDHKHLAKAAVDPSGRLSIGHQNYRTLIVPDGVDLPQNVAAIAQQFSASGGRLLQAMSERGFSGMSPVVQSGFQLLPAAPELVLARFQRDGREIGIVVNVGRHDYAGKLCPPANGNWLRLDPATGAITRAVSDAQGQLPLDLAPYQTQIVVQDRAVSSLP
jgi:hypothetical protein